MAPGERRVIDAFGLSKDAVYSIKEKNKINHNVTRTEVELVNGTLMAQEAT